MADQKRGNAYYLERMETEHPTIFADYKAGKLTAAQAIVLAGYRKKETPKVIIERAWARASASERDEIRQLVCGSGTTAMPRAFSVATGPVAMTSAIVVFDASGQLTIEGKSAIQDRMRLDRLSQSDVMDLLGFRRLNVSLWNAMRQDTAIRDRNLRDAISTWINRGT